MKLCSFVRVSGTTQSTVLYCSTWWVAHVGDWTLLVTLVLHGWATKSGVEILTMLEILPGLQ
jgi:hypothetical protein